MSTYVYGGRDFKGNIVSNAAMQPFADLAALNAFTPPLDANSGQQAWVTSEKKPYWWDTTANGGAGAWITLGGGGTGDYYGVQSGVTGSIPETPCGGGPARPRYYGYSDTHTPILSAARLADFPEISAAHKLTVDLRLAAGFTVATGDPETELYNRYGELNVRTTISTLPTGTTTHPGFAGTWTHGWVQGLGVETLDGKLGPDWTTVAKTVETQLVRNRWDGTGDYGTEAVDTHIAIVGAYPEDSCRLAIIDSGIPTEIITWQLDYDETNGLRLHATSLSSSNFWLAFTYTGAWNLCSDPFPGMFCIPSGFYTTYWF